MLVSHTHKFIYLKTKKTASTSIELFLKPWCDNGIAVTETHAHVHAKNIKKLIGEEVWQAYTKICPIRNPWDQLVSYYHWKKRKRSPLSRLRRITSGKGFYHPAEKMDFLTFIHHEKSIQRLNLNSRIIKSEDKDDYFFIRYENLEEDLRSLCQHLELNYDERPLGNNKSQYRKERGYQHFYNEETRKLVEDAYQWEIEKFGYRF